MVAPACEDRLGEGGARFLCEGAEGAGRAGLQPGRAVGGPDEVGEEVGVEDGGGEGYEGEVLDERRWWRLGLGLCLMGG